MVIHHIYPDDGDGGDFENAGFLLNIDMADPMTRFST
jgi:hypothetical protein